MPDSINKYARKRLEDLEDEAMGRPKKAGVGELKNLRDRVPDDEDEKRRQRIARENRARLKRGEKAKPIR